MALSNPNRNIVPRGRVWKKFKRTIHVRDEWGCLYCGKKPLVPKQGTDFTAECDHIKPLKMGGEDEAWNYATACRPCNRAKGGKFSEAETPVPWKLYHARKETALRAALAGKFAEPGPAAAPALPRPKRTTGQRLADADLEAMWRAYQAKPTTSHVAGATGVHHRTCDRIIKRGDEARGVEAFEARLARIRAEANRIADQTAAEQTARRLVQVRTLVDKALGRMTQINESTGEVELSLMPDYNDIDKLLRLEAFLAGGADSRGELVHKRKFESMSDVELAAFIEEKRRKLEAAGGSGSVH